jgi:hypothetical protein
MASLNTVEEEIRRFEKQRNLFIVLAGCSIISIAFAVPRRVAVYNEHRLLNARLIELQTSIVADQKQTVEIQAEIESDQLEIEKRLQR